MNLGSVKKFCARLAILAGALIPVYGNVATSPNYAFTYLSIDAGGQRSSAGAYALDTVMTMAGGPVAGGPYRGSIGYAGQLNNPPIAQPDIAIRQTNQVSNISLNYILANDFDPDGDAMSLFSAETRSAAGGNVGFFPASLQYTPPPGYNGVDTFRYTIADDFNDTADALITVVVAHLPPDQPINSVLLYILNDGKILLRLQAAPGFSSYTIQGTDSIVAPNWRNLATTGAGSEGNLFALDEPGPNSPHRFYRAVFR